MGLRDGFTLGEWAVYPLEGRLVREEDARRVQPKSMDVLLCLAEAAGEVVERETLLLAVWGERAQSDEPLTRCIGELRRVLGDTRADPEYILTVPKRGYRLLKPVVGRAAEADNESELNLTESQSRRRLDTAKKVAVAVAVLLLATLIEVGIERAFESSDSSVEDSVSRDVAPNTELQPSIAVLSFANLSSDAEQEYFSDGISEELLNLLARIRELRVISRSSAFSFKGKEIDIPTIAKQLNVTHVLDGSVRKVGDRVRISAQLIEARSATYLWSETYERTLDDIFATQDEIAAKVVEQLKIKLLDDVPTVQAIDPEAYALVLQARYLGRQFSPGALDTSVALFERALQISPDYAAAWAELARGYRRQASQGLRSFDEGYALAREAANRALALDPTHAPAHRGLAFIARNYDRDLAAAAQHYQHALTMDPSDAETILGAASMAESLGRMNQAIPLAEYATARDPVSPIANTYLGLTYLRAGRLDEAIESFRTALTLSPGYIGMSHLIGIAMLQKGDLDSALAITQEEADEGYRLIGLAMIYHALGQAAASDAAVAQLIEKYAHDSAYNIAYVMAFRNEAERAFEWLQLAVSNNDTGLSEIVTETLFANIWPDQRWLPFLESIGKSPDQLAAIEFDISAFEVL